MPNYKGHLSGGCMTFALVLVFVVPYCPPSFFSMIEWLLFTLAGSLFPDIDIKSKGQKYFYWIMLLLFVVLALNRQYKHLAIISVLSVIPHLVKHRGMFHRLWFVIAIPLIAWFVIVQQFPNIYTALLINTIFFIAGAISHLWLDMGIKMFRF